MTNTHSTPTSLTLEQKRALYRDGYVIVRNAISEELVEAALERIHTAKKGENIGRDKAMTDLVNASTITPIMQEAMGKVEVRLVQHVA